MHHTKSRQPDTLLALTIAQENARHKRRLAEIDRAATKLAMFEPVFRQLDADGIHVSLEQLRAQPAAGDTRNTELHITSCGGLADWDQPLLDALMAQGFTETHRNSSGGLYARVTLKKGRLALLLMIRADGPHAAAAASAAVPTTSQPQPERCARF